MTSRTLRSVLIWLCLVGVLGAWAVSRDVLATKTQLQVSVPSGHRRGVEVIAARPASQTPSYSSQLDRHATRAGSLKLAEKRLSFLPTVPNDTQNPALAAWTSTGVPVVDGGEAELYVQYPNDAFITAKRWPVGFYADESAFETEALSGNGSDARKVTIGSEVLLEWDSREAKFAIAADKSLQSVPGFTLSRPFAAIMWYDSRANVTYLVSAPKGGTASRLEPLMRTVVATARSGT